MEAGAYALLIGEKNGNRQMPIIIGATEAQAIVMELRGITPPRPLTHVLFASVLEALRVRLLRVLIYRVENGVFYAYLYLRSEETILRVDSRTSDAIVLALRMGAPIFIYEDILEDEHIPINTGDDDEKNVFFQESYNRRPSLNTLKKALQKAIDKEDYERAAILRDQINLYNQDKQ